MEVEYKEGTLGLKSVLKSVCIFSLTPSYLSVMKHVVKPNHFLSVVTNQVSVVKPQLDPARAFMMALKAFKARSTQSRTWEPKVKLVSSLSYRILGFLFYGVTSSPIAIVSEARTGGNPRWTGPCFISGGQRPVAYHLPTSPKVVQSKFTIASTILEAELGQQREVASIGRHVSVCN